MSSTTASWARPIQSHEEIPDIFKGHIPAVDFLPHIVYSPADHWGKKQTNAKLTCMYHDKIIILEVVKDKIIELCYWFKDINYIEQGKLLLYSWIGIHGFVDGDLSTSIVEYNSVVTPYFNPIVKAVRQIYPIPEILSGGRELSKLQFLNTLNYKFFNYSIESILLGEKIIGTAYQNEIYEKFMCFFTRIITLAHLTILTDKELIIIKEEELVEEKRKSLGKNCGVWAYIPLHRILNIFIENNEDRNVLALVISTRQNDITLTFSPLKRNEFEALINEFRDIFVQGD